MQQQNQVLTWFIPAFGVAMTTKLSELLRLRFDFVTFVDCSYSVSKTFTRSDEVFGSVRVPSEGSRY